MNELFLKASRLKLRFDSPKGQLTVEDLWDIPLTSATGKPNLNDIARELHGKVKVEIVSFVEPAVKNDIDELRFEIVKHVITVRVAERDVAAKAQLVAEQKQQIMSLIKQKEVEQLGASSIDDLKALLASL